MDKNLNKILIDKIVESLPSHIKPVNYLMEILNLGKDSAYRRLKDEIPFSFEEVIILSNSLGFAMDEVVGKSKTNRILFDRYNFPTVESQKFSLIPLQKLLDYLIQMHNAAKKQTITAINRIFLIYSSGHEQLFRFLYYKWMHQTNQLPTNFQLADFNIPEEDTSVFSKVNYYYFWGDNNTFILDRNIYLNTIREIQYYYKRGLISNEEINLLKEDLLEHINSIEKIAQTGINKVGGKCDIYISTLNIESCSSFSEFDQDIRSDYWIDSMDIITTHDPEMSNINKRWLESLKKYAVLITKSNEMLQSRFFNQQRIYLDAIESDEFMIKLY